MTPRKTHRADDILLTRTSVYRINARKGLDVSEGLVFSDYRYSPMTGLWHFLVDFYSPLKSQGGITVFR